MPEEPWVTVIAISCDNEALRPLWSDIEYELRQIVYLCGWDTRLVTIKVKAIRTALRQVRNLTVDMNKPLSKRFK